jgi:trimeric autotransporter adhesin
MKSLPRLSAVVVFSLSILILFAGCSGLPHNTTKTLTSIAVTPASPAHLKVGATQQFTATGTFSDNSTADISSTVTWASGSTATATISASGLATGVAAGTTQITAATSGVTSPGVTLTVISLSSIAVTPATPAHLKVGATQQFTATATFTDGSTSDVTSTVTWTSGTPTTATISAAGLATGVAQGTTQITAAMSGVTSPGVTLTVISLTSIAVTPNPATVAIAATLQFTATGTFNDASTANITSQVTWNSATTSVATINAAGLATGVSAGGSNITATLGTVVSPIVVLAVGGAVVPVSLKISPANPSIITGQTADFTVVELLSDGSTQATTGTATWTSGTTATASIIPAVGITTGLATGTSTITATEGTLTGNTTLTVSAAVPRFVYTIGPNDGVTSGFAINAPANALAPIPATVDPGTSLQLVFEPSGHFAYGAGFDGAIRIYSVDPVSGVLSPSGLSGIAPGGLPSFVPSVTSIGQSVIDPSGRFLYVVDGGTNFVNAFSINVDTTSPNYGNLTTIGAAVATGSFPFGAAITPNGKFLYVTDSDSTASSISGYSIGADGSLTPIALTASQLTTLNGPAIPVIDPTGQFLYVPNSGGPSVTAFSASATTGDLTRIGTTDISTNLNAPNQAVTDPAGAFLFVTNQGNGTVAVFSIGPTGALTATSTASSGGGSNSIPLGIAIDRAGSFAVVTNNGENTVTLFTLSAGVLTPKYTAGSRVIPFFASFYSGTASPMIGPSNVFAANSASGNLSGYTANNATGILGTATTATGQSGNAALAADITGNFLYSTSASAQSIGGFSITPSTAVLAALSGSPFSLTTATDVPSDIASEPSSRFVYVADATTNNIETFSTAGSTLSSLGQPSPSPFTSVNAIAVDTQGTYIIAFGNGSITSAGIDGFAGTLLPGVAANTLTQTGNWTSGAVDPTGHWIVALDSAGKALQPIAFEPIQNSFTTPDGTLTAQGLPLSTGLTTPSAVIFDPLGRFVFVSDATAGKIAVFSFNESTGALAVLGTPITVDATGTGKVSIDASGTYLYAALTGNGGSVPSAVTAYKINSNGTLAAVAGSPFPTGAGTSGTSGVAVTSSVQ